MLSKQDKGTAFLGAVAVAGFLPILPFLAEVSLHHGVVNIATLFVTATVLPITVATASPYSLPFWPGLAGSMLMAICYGAVAYAGSANPQATHVLVLQVSGPPSLTGLAVWGEFALLISLVYLLLEQLFALVRGQQTFPALRKR